MPVQHPRKQLAGLLTTALPATWRVVAAKRSIDPPVKTTVVVKQLGVDKPPQLPRGARTIRFVLTLISRHTDPDKAEDDLDSALPDLLDVLDQVRNLTWTSSDYVLVDDKYLGVDVQVTTATKKGNH